MDHETTVKVVKPSDNRPDSHGGHFLPMFMLSVGSLSAGWYNAAVFQVMSRTNADSVTSSFHFTASWLISNWENDGEETFSHILRVEQHIWQFVGS